MTLKIWEIMVALIFLKNRHFARLSWKKHLISPLIIPSVWFTFTMSKVVSSKFGLKGFLRIPPLYAKNGANRGFWYSVIISVHKYGTHTDLIWLIDLHSKCRFLSKLSMIHVCDVIKLSYKKARQKLNVKHNSKMVIPFHFSSSNSSF